MTPDRLTSLTAPRGVLWARQIAAVLRLEVKKTFLRRSALPVYLLALAPPALLVLRVVFVWTGGSTGGPAGSPPGATMAYAGLFQVYYLRLGVFFGCVAIFTRLIRGEILDQTLHYYLLAPLRREILVAGKYLAGWIASTTLFGISVAASFLLIYLPFGSRFLAAFLLEGPGLGHLASYLTVTALACLGYGSVFLLMGLLFRNPIVPAAVVLGWESIHLLLPPILQKMSVIHYLQSLSPVTVPVGPLAILADPTPAWVAVPGLLGVTVVVLVLACLRLRRFEPSAA